MRQAAVVMTDAVIEKMKADGIGTDTDPNYKPAIGEWCPDLLDIQEQFPVTPWRQGDLNRATPYRVRIESYQSDLQILDRARNLIGSPFLCVATDLASGIIVAIKVQPLPPDTTAMESFCTTVLDKLNPAPAGVEFHVDRSEGVDWNRIAMTLGLSISRSAMHEYRR